MSEFQERCAREDEEDRLARHVGQFTKHLAPVLTGPEAVEIAVAALLRANEEGCIVSWNIRFRDDEGRQWSDTKVPS